MGILNVTPDSFHATSRATITEDLIIKAGEMLKAGADILDMGGQSTRPGATRISAEEEKSRIIPAIEAVHRSFPEAIISVDTFYAAVAEDAVSAGASIINDVSGGAIDQDMFETVGRLHVPYVLTHIQGEPQTMQHNPIYQDVIGEIVFYFSEKIDLLKKAGVKDILLDPGFGFGKKIEHNLQIMRELDQFNIFGMPVLVGLSRKKTIQQLLDVDAANALNGTTIMNTLALAGGAQILRVHDVKEAKEVVKVMMALNAV